MDVTSGRTVAGAPAIGGFVGRTAFFAAVTSWWEQGTERYFLLGGGVGTGKTSALARYRHPAVAAAHFCDPRDVATRRPAVAAGTLAAQLSRRLDGYSAALVEPSSADQPVVSGTASAAQVHAGGVNAGVFISTLVVNRGSDQETWDRLLRHPLERLAQRGSGPVLIIVDGLDEAERYDGTTLTELLVGTADRSPIRWLVSTRYPNDVVARLQGGAFRLWNLSEGAGAAETAIDLDRFLRDQLGGLAAPPGPADFDAILSAAVARSNGNFLYARLLAETLHQLNGPATLRDLDNAPAGLDGILGGYLRGLVHSDKEVGWLNGYEPLVSALSVLREPVEGAALRRLSGVSSALTTRVLTRVRPLLDAEVGVPTDGATAARGTTIRYSLYHAAFREFLADPHRAGEWWCDPAEAHERVVASYRLQTRGWQDWSALDDYGVSHLLDHARGAGWSAERLHDLVVVPGYIARMAQQPGTVAAVVRQLQVPIRVATAEPDLPRAFLWSWAARSLRSSLYELLTSEAPALLAKAGQGELAISALASIDPGDPFLPSMRRQVAEILASEGNLTQARAVISLAPAHERPALLVACAIGTVPVDPGRACELYEEASQAAAKHPAAPISGTDEFAVVLAGAPAQAERAWVIAGDDADVKERVAHVLAQHNPKKAVQIALRHRWPDVLVAACDVLARTDPAQAWKVLDDCDFGRQVWTRAAVAVATQADLPPMTPQRLAESAGRSPVAQLLVLAAARSRSELDADLANHARRLIRSLDQYDDWLFTVYRDHEVAASVDLLPLLGRQEAVELAVPAVSLVIRVWAGRSEHDIAERRRDSELLGRLCATLWTLDRAAGAAVVAAARQENWLDADDFGRGLVERLCPIDPETAWGLAQDSRTASRAWAAALPPSRLPEAIRLVAGMDPKYSGSRAELAGLLATKLPPGDRDSARNLMQLVTPTTQSAGFAGDRQVLRAAFADQETVDRGLLAGEAPDPAAERVIAYAFARRRRDVAALLWHQLRRSGANVAYDARPIALVDLASAVADRTKTTAIAVLANAATWLLAGIADIDESVHEEPARQLLEECLHPGYRPRSAHVPRWPGTARATALAHATWRRHRAPAGEAIDRFYDTLNVLALRREKQELPEMVLPLTERLNPAEKRSLLAWATIRDPQLAQALTILEDVRQGQRGARDCEDDLDLLLGDDLRGGRYVVLSLVGLARLQPQETVSLLRRPAAPNLVSVFNLIDADDVLIQILPAVAEAHLSYGVDLANEMRRRRPRDARGRDALHTVAVAASATDWAVGDSIARSIDFDGVRAMALGDLAAAATRLPSAEARRSAYMSVLDNAAALPPGSAVDYPIEGVVAALGVEAEPMADVVVRLVPEVFRKDGVDRATCWFLVADLACTLARITDPAAVRDRIGYVEQLVTSAWTL